MTFKCRGCGQELEVADESIKVGKFSDLKIITIPEHDFQSVRCTCSGLSHVPGISREFVDAIREGCQPVPHDAEAVGELSGLAMLAIERRLCSRLIADAAADFQGETGHELSGVVRRILARIRISHEHGRRYTPKQVAKILRGTAEKIRRGEDPGRYR